jgi:putative ABC transport system substrate-binding protein
VPADVAASLEVFDSAMRQLGYIKGTDYVVLERMAAGRDDVLRAMAEELVARKVDLIFAGATNAVVEASRLTSTIPIVFVSVSNPVLSGFAESLAHPGRNVTGISNITRDLGPKRLELLKQMVPALARVSLLVNPASANYPGFVTRLQTFAPSLGVRTSILETRTPVEIDAAFAHLAESRDHGMYVAADAFLFNQRRQIAELALAKRLPTVSPAAECVESGGLMSYGVDSSDWMRLAAGYVDKIFRGAHPGDLPIEETSRVELVINRKTAAAMQMRIPPAMELQATRLID